MGTRGNQFAKIAEFRARFANVQSERLRERLNFGALQKEAAITIRQLLEERVVNQDSATTIFVALLGEGVDVWRPVQASALAGGLFRIESENNHPDTETWQFSVGHCRAGEHRTFAEGERRLVAVEARQPPA